MKDYYSVAGDCSAVLAQRKDARVTTDRPENGQEPINYVAGLKNPQVGAYIWVSPRTDGDADGPPDRCPVCGAPLHTRTEGPYQNRPPDESGYDDFDEDATARAMVIFGDSIVMSKLTKPGQLFQLRHSVCSRDPVCGFALWELLTENDS